jgi:hypothetical protein
MIRAIPPVMIELFLFRRWRTECCRNVGPGCGNFCFRDRPSFVRSGAKRLSEAAHSTNGSRSGGIAEVGRGGLGAGEGCEAAQWRVGPEDAAKCLARALARCDAIKLAAVAVPRRGRRRGTANWSYDVLVRDAERVLLLLPQRRPQLHKSGPHNSRRPPSQPERRLIWIMPQRTRQTRGASRPTSSHN